MGPLGIPWARMLLHDILDYRAREDPEAEFAVQGSRTLFYSGAQALANRIGNADLAKLHSGAGHHEQN